MKPAMPMRSLLLTLGERSPDIAQELPVRTVILNGYEMAYCNVGAGEPLLLPHGFGSCAGERWASFAAPPAPHYRLTLNAHGHSTNPSGTFTHRQATEDVLQSTH